MGTRDIERQAAAQRALRNVRPSGCDTDQAELDQFACRLSPFPGKRRIILIGRNSGGWGWGSGTRATSDANYPNAPADRGRATA